MGGIEVERKFSLPREPRTAWGKSILDRIASATTAKTSGTMEIDMTRYVSWFVVVLGVTLGFTGCDVEDEGTDWRDAEIEALEQELAASELARAQAEWALASASDASAAVDADGDADDADDDEDGMSRNYACCVANSDRVKACKGGGSFDTEQKCENEGGVFYPAPNGRTVCASECEGKVAPAPIE